MNYQPPTSNLQASKKASFERVDDWNLDILWSLEVGIWRFRQ